MVARMKFVRLGALALASFAMNASLHAQVLQDPTRPPASLLASPATAASAPESAMQLQSVLLGKGRTPAAVISGEVVMLGARFRDARLVRVTERSAVLKGPQGETTLALIPANVQPGHSPATPESNR
jgi:hypothetical protein